ncbi:MAG: metalloregulator ArsR/SmtB family transcription factor [Bacteroidales bacterium]|nr:metalloregulator ArsR/SmtB family transcription factor [Bacteroidales bacterium]
MVAAKTELFETNLQENAMYFKVLAHPARLKILKFLSEAKSCIRGDVSGELPLKRTTVNRHLKELKDAGLIQGHVQGKNVNYCLVPEKIEEMKTLISGFLFMLNENCDFYCE